MIAYWVYKLGYFLATHLPLKVTYSIASFLSILKYYFSPRDRNAVLANLNYILPESEKCKIHRYAKEVFIDFGKYLIEFFRFSLWDKESLGKLIKIKGLDYVDEALKKGKGVIILAAHIGNWELGGVYMSMLGYPIVGVALPHRHKKVNEFFNFQRERMGMSVIPSTGLAIRRIYDALSKNKLVALVGDRDFAGTGEPMPFLGAKKIIPKGPAILSKRTGAPIIPGFITRQKDDTHFLEFFPPISNESSEIEVIKEYTKIIEKLIRQKPGQWLMFREFWKE